MLLLPCHLRERIIFVVAKLKPSSREWKVGRRITIPTTILGVSTQDLADAILYQEDQGSPKIQSTKITELKTIKLTGAL